MASGFQFSITKFRVSANRPLVLSASISHVFSRSHSIAITLFKRCEDKQIQISELQAAELLSFDDLRA